MTDFKETAWDSLSCSEFATLTTNERKWITKVLSLQAKHPDDIIIKVPPDKNNGVLVAAIPKNWLRINPPKKMKYTDEQKAAIAARLKGARSNE